MEGDRLRRVVERIFWLIRLRWLAAFGVIGTVVFTRVVLDVSFPFVQLIILALVLASYNLVFYLITSRISKRRLFHFSVASRIANAQISLDLAILAILIHFSGGVENPFIFYFIFHMIIASILLSRRASFMQASLAVVLFSLMVILECLEIIPHYCLEGFIAYTQHNNVIYISGVSFVFISTLYIAVYMATSITNRLREQEKSLESANKLLKEKDRIKSEYVLRVTHDIKEHLSAIQSCLEPVAKGITGALNDAQKNLFNRAVQRTSKLSFFVRALLDITKIKLTKKITMDWFSLGEILKSISEDIKVRAKNKNLSFKADLDPVIDKFKGVRVYIEETISNILVNAIKYTPDGGEVILTAKKTPDAIQIQIKDTGIGIPKDDLPRIFEEFYRAKNARAIEKQGTGLGLAMAKEVVEMHKGKIWIESEEGSGTKLNIEFPA